MIKIRALLSVLRVPLLLIALLLYNSTSFANGVQVQPDAALSTEEVIHERYYTVTIDGQRVGWMLDRRTRSVAGLVTSTNEFLMTLARLGTEIDIGSYTRFVETDEDGELTGGAPVSMLYVTKDSASSRQIEYVWTTTGINVVDTDMDSGQAVRWTADAIEGLESRPNQLQVAWLTPLGSEAFVRARRAAGVTDISYTTISPDTGLRAATIREQYDSTWQEFELFDKRIKVQAVTSTNSLTGDLEGRFLTDKDGVVVQFQTIFGTSTLTATMTDKESALEAFDPPEMMAQTAIRPDGVANGVIEDPRAVRRASYILHALDGELLDLPSSGHQSFERIDESKGRVVVDLTQRLSHGNPDAYTGATSLANAADPAVVEFAERIMHQANAQDQMTDGNHVEAAAESLRRGVYRHITTKSLAAGFASASDVVRDREGDCTEHACLFVAAARSKGMSARAVSGLIYADAFATNADEQGAFAYHMWAQVWVPSDRGAGGAWVDFDPSWPNRFDATHIALQTSDLSDNATLEASIQTASFIGNLRIEVESLERR